MTPDYEADSLVHLGDAHAAADQTEPAIHALQHALAILERFDDTRDADAVRAKLTHLTTSRPHNL